MAGAGAGYTSGDATATAEEDQRKYSLETDDPDDVPAQFKSLFFAVAVYRGVWPDWFPQDAPKRTGQDSREQRMIGALPMFEPILSHVPWERFWSVHLMRGHLSCIVAWNKQKRTSNDNPETKRSEGPPPSAPLTMIDLVADTIPTFDGLRVFYASCSSSLGPEDVLKAVQRRMR
jgi:hypothetical protein